MKTNGQKALPSLFKINTGDKVKVYRNLAKDCFSIVDYNKKIVNGYARKIWLTNVIFKVSEKGRQRVLAEKRKNVHAYVIGNYLNSIEELNKLECLSLKQVKYNPYASPFFLIEGVTPIKECKYCLLQDNKIWIIE